MYQTYKESSPEKYLTLEDIIKENTVYICKEDINCKNGIFNKNTPVLLELYKSRNNPEIKITELEEMLNSESDPIKYDVIDSIPVQQFQSMFEVDERTTAIYKNIYNKYDNDMNEIDCKEDAIHRILMFIAFSGSFMLLIGCTWSMIAETFYNKDIKYSITVMTIAFIALMIYESIIGICAFIISDKINNKKKEIEKTFIKRRKSLLKPIMEKPVV